MTYQLRLVACLFLCISLNSFGALYDRGNGLIYDDVLDITWLQDANYAQTSGYDTDGLMTRTEAGIWVSQLIYEGYDDWRLPSAGPGPGEGYNVTTGEWGYMFSNSLGNVSAGTNPTCYNGPELCLKNTSFVDPITGSSKNFLNLLPSDYWLEELAPDTNYSWVFSASGGYQYRQAVVHNYHSWAVHDGDIGASPVPIPAAAWLFGSALVGFGLVRRIK